MTENEIGDVIVDAALKVHSELGAGLLESVYEACLLHELLKRGLTVGRQVPCPIVYDGLKIDGAFRLDLVVGEKVVVEVKAVEKLMPVHTAQILTYLKLGNFKLGYLLNFDVAHMKDGIKRTVNQL
jgi:GxxExxY protein